MSSSSSWTISQHGPRPNVPTPKPSDTPDLSSTNLPVDLKAPTSQDDDSEMWEEYVKAASMADDRLISDWSASIDSVLIYAALLIGVLATFIVDTSTQFERDPVAISNDLLVAIYKRLADPSAPLINTDDLFKLDPADYKKVAEQNFLLYLSLGVSVIVTGVAAASKVWILRFGRAINNPGTSFERAMARQRAYSGMKAWKLEVFIESLNILMLIVIYMFGLFNYFVLLDANAALALAFAASFALGFVLVMIPTIVAAFIPTAPFHSIFSEFIEFFFRRVFPDFHFHVPLGARRRPFNLRNIGISIVSLLCFGAAGYLIPQRSLTFVLILVFPLTGIYAVSGGFIEKENMRPRLFNPPLLLVIGSVFTVPTLGLALYFATQHGPLYIVFFTLPSIFMIAGGFAAVNRSATVPKMTEAEAIGWMITSSATQDLRWYHKAVELSEKSPNLRPVLYNLLFPGLKRLITSSRHGDKTDETPEQESLIQHLARLADFEDTKRDIFHDIAPFDHGRLPPDDPLHEKLSRVAGKGCPAKSSNCRCVRCSAAIVLQKFGEVKMDRPMKT